MREKNKLHLAIKVQPRARKPGIEKLDTGEYRVRVHAAPAKGEANLEVIKSLASHFGVPPSHVRIVRGMKSRNKAVVVEFKTRG